MRERMIHTLYRHCRIFQFRWWWAHSIVAAPLHRPYSNRVQIVLVSLEPVVSKFQYIKRARTHTHTKKKNGVKNEFCRWRKRIERQNEIECAHTGGRASKRLNTSNRMRKLIIFFNKKKMHHHKNFVYTNVIYLVHILKTNSNIIVNIVMIVRLRYHWLIGIFK